MRRTLIGLFLFAGWLGATSQSQAAVLYSYVTNQSSFVATPGSTISVNLYLQETLTAGSTSLISGNSGLFGAGVAVQQTSFSGTTATTISSAMLNSTPIGVGGGFGPNGFPFNQIDISGGGSNAALLQSIAPMAPSGPTPDAQGRILLGTLTLTTGSVGSVTTYSVTDFLNGVNPLAQNAGPGNTITRGPAPLGLDLDSSNNASNGPPTPSYTVSSGPNLFTITVVPLAPVPEPATWALLTVAAVGAGLGKFSRRFRKSASV